MKKDELHKDIINVEKKLTKLESKMPKSILQNLEKFTEKKKLSDNARNKLRNLNTLTKEEIEALRIQVQKYEATPKQQAESEPRHNSNSTVAIVS